MEVYNKLVRDNIPQIIKKTNKIPHTHILTDEEYLIELDNKLSEEFNEYQTDKNIEELADMVEVIYAITKARGSSVEKLEKIRKAKIEKNGAFEKKIYLEGCE